MSTIGLGRLTRDKECSLGRRSAGSPRSGTRGDCQGAGTIVTRDVAAGVIVVGNPARKR